MVDCVVCGTSVDIDDNNTLIIPNVPDSTFDFSETTVNLNIFCCSYCGTVQLYDTPLSQNYLEVYRSIGISSEYREKKKQQLESFIDDYKLQNKDVIEIGCGDGQLLEIFREFGLECKGVEVGVENSIKCKKNKFLIHSGPIKDISKQYDAFFTSYYLEHLPEPNKFISELYRILKPGGVGLIEVPNYDYIEKNKIWLEFTKDHRVYYGEKTLCYLLFKNGFEGEIIKSDDLCLSVIVKKPIPEPVNLFMDMKDKIKKDENEFKNLIYSFGGDFVVFGAGHYSQLLITNLYKNYGIKPKHIFDSNKNKCGKKLCGVTIEHKDNLTFMTDCSKIVIICGVYNKEVEKMLQDMNTNSQWEIVSWN